MKIVSWNVNGLSACNNRGYFSSTLRYTNADIFCCQEIKGRCYLDTPGYLQFWNPALRPGYSGTLVLSKMEPLSCHYDLGVDAVDGEGRLISLEFRDFYVINVYVPNSQRSAERLNYRVAWDNAFREYLAKLKKPAIICGDFNVAHKYIDVYPENLRNEENPPGFISEERHGMDQLLALGYVDVFRELYPKREGAYTWWSMRLHKRNENRGWRLDYFLISAELMPLVNDMWHMKDTIGSDHCPISLAVRSDLRRQEIPLDRLEVMWREIDWEYHEQYVNVLQHNLAVAASKRDWDHIAILQRELTRSFSAKALAVRHVAENDAMPGIDGVKWTTEADKMRAVYSLTSRDYKAKPYRNILLRATKSGEKDRRANVPVAYDKAMMYLYSMALAPVAETTGDRMSFSARRGRSLFDLDVFLRRVLIRWPCPECVLIADVKGCYDHINHSWLLENIPMERWVLREFLKAGYIQRGQRYDTEVGISQGASLSPVLANMTLDGLQDFLYQKLYPNGDIDYQDAQMFRFADDIIITAKTRAQADNILDLLREFLSYRGLTVNEGKTRIEYVEQGFDFVARHYQKHGETLYVYPSEKAIEGKIYDLREFIGSFKGSQRALILKLNKKLQGIATYHRVSNATEAFKKIDTAVRTFLLDKLKAMYPKRPIKKLKDTFWEDDGSGYHVFSLPENPDVYVHRLEKVPLIQYKAIRANFNPYLDNDYAIYLREKRKVQKAGAPILKAIRKRQENLCIYCGLPMLPDQTVELVEKEIGQGFTIMNSAYAHQRCVYAEHTEVFDTVELLPILETLLDEKQSGRNDPQDPYFELRQFFHTATTNPLTLTFKQIEDMIGDSLPAEAYRHENFWYDESTDFKRKKNRETAISESWLSQGYKIKWLRLPERKVVFRLEDKNLSGLVIPKELTEKKIPTEAAEKLKAYFRKIIAEYGL